MRGGAFGIALCAVAAVPARAQSFNQAIIFGDSTVDSGYYKILASPGGANAFNMLWGTAVAAGAGAPTTNPGLMNSQFLASYFGLTALPANQGGTNYATSGAKDVTVNNSHTGGFTEAIPTVTQIDNYLAANNGIANPNALYLISSGGNDVSYALGATGQGPFPVNPHAYLVGAATSLAASIAALQAAGARYIVVPDLPFSFPRNNLTQQQDQLLYSQTLWSSLAAQSVQFIPADWNAVRVAIAANPTAFGFISVSNAVGQTACSKPTNVTTAWALLCSSNPAAPSHFVTPNADQIYLFADDQHLTTAGQKIEADYYYSLIVAPSEISFLAESEIQTRLDVITGIQQQIDLSQRQRPAGFNVWVNGDISSLEIANRNPGFPGDPSAPVSATAGIDYHWHNGVLVGGAITVGTLTPGFDLGGGFTQNEAAGSIYAGYRGPLLWGDVVGTYGSLRDSVNRVVPIGITRQSNTGATDGSDLSLAAEIGSDLVTGWLTHGPIAGIILQKVHIAGFTETGSFTSLTFGDQARDSAITALGYRASFEMGPLRPFAQVVWDHELASTDRQVTASLTTIAAPSYSLPAVEVGRDWATATAGINVQIGGGLTGLASFTAQVGQSGVTNYGGLIGLNYAFD